MAIVKVHMAAAPGTYARYYQGGRKSEHLVSAGKRRGENENHVFLWTYIPYSLVDFIFDFLFY
jgi:hypothetical protein